MDQITLTLPDDWHPHLRDNETASTVPAATRGFGRGIIMPNIVPPATTVERVAAYRERILAQRPAGSNWEPLMVSILPITPRRMRFVRPRSAVLSMAANTIPPVPPPIPTPVLPT